MRDATCTWISSYTPVKSIKSCKSHLQNTLYLRVRHLGSDDMLDLHYWAVRKNVRRLLIMVTLGSVVLCDGKGPGGHQCPKVLKKVADLEKEGIHNLSLFYISCSLQWLTPKVCWMYTTSSVLGSGERTTGKIGLYDDSQRYKCYIQILLELFRRWLWKGTMMLMYERVVLFHFSKIEHYFLRSMNLTSDHSSTSPPYYRRRSRSKVLFCQARQDDLEVWGQLSGKEEKGLLHQEQCPPFTFWHAMTSRGQYCYVSFSERSQLSIKQAISLSHHGLRAEHRQSFELVSTFVVLEVSSLKVFGCSFPDGVTDIARFAHCCVRHASTKRCFCTARRLGQG